MPANVLRNTPQFLPLSNDQFPCGKNNGATTTVFFHSFNRAISTKGVACLRLLVAVARLRAKTPPFGGQARHLSKISFLVSLNDPACNR